MSDNNQSVIIFESSDYESKEVMSISLFPSYSRLTGKTRKCREKKIVKERLRLGFIVKTYLLGEMFQT